MIAGRSVLAVVPARSGSKGIPLKNLRNVGGRPLVARVGDVIANVPEIDRAVVSTDHPEIARVAEESGLAVPFMRPATISGDQISDFDVLYHALNATEKADNRRYDVIVMLQPTSPLRTPDEVSATIRMLIEGEWDSVWTVSPTDSKAHPLKQLIISDNGLSFYDPKGAAIIARQQLSPVYHRNGIAYAMTRDCLLNQKTITGNKTGALVVEGERISIDTEWDIELVEILLGRQAQAKSV